MKRYEKYKQEDGFWLDAVPFHWNVLPLKYCYSFQIGWTPPTGKDEYFVGNNLWANISDMKGKHIESTAKCISDEAVRLSGRKISPKGSLFYSFKLSVGSVSFCDKEMYTNEAIATFLPGKNSLRFLYYMAPVFLIKNANTNIYGASIMNQELIKNAKIVIPPLSEQTAIASYLDRKVADIDSMISKAERKIELLEELKKSVITEAVTKGLDKNAKMKDSGVKWIGKVPEGWKVMRTRFLCKIKTGDKDTINRVDDGIYPFYVRSPKVERINSYTFDGEAVLMAGDGVGAGKVFHYVNGKFDYHQRVYNLHNFKIVIGKFFYYYIVNNFKYIIEEASAKNTVDSVRLGMIQDFPVLIPNIEEQKDIVAYLDKKVQTIDSQMSKARKRIELLKELKQTLITDVVTGKIKVTE